MGGTLSWFYTTMETSCWPTDVAVSGRRSSKSLWKRCRAKLRGHRSVRTLTLAEFQQQLSQRLRRLRRDARPIVHEQRLDPEGCVYHRVSAPHGEPVAATLLLRSSPPLQSVTLGEFASDGFDAHIIVDKDAGYQRVEPDRVVVWWTRAQLASVEHVDDERRYALYSEHDPYEENYAHGGMGASVDEKRDAKRLRGRRAKDELRHRLFELVERHEQRLPRLDR